MLFSPLQLAATASLFFGSALAGAPLLESFAQLAVDSGIVLSGLNTLALANSIFQLQGSCTLDKLKFRQEWYGSANNSSLPRPPRDHNALTMTRRTLSSNQRKNFISAVKCIQSKPSLFPTGAVPGSKGLFEDFAAVHVNQTLNIHLTVGRGDRSHRRRHSMVWDIGIADKCQGNFLTWHRYYIHTYEKALQNCGYTGRQILPRKPQHRGVHEGRC